jgi:hypothetical protein
MFGFLLLPALSTEPRLIWPVDIHFWPWYEFVKKKSEFNFYIEEFESSRENSKVH